jgi:hypothetical protein
MTTAKTMAADDEDNEVDDEGAMGDARWAMAQRTIMATTTTMVMGDGR